MKPESYYKKEYTKLLEKYKNFELEYEESQWHC